jgi:hypothetical protein
LIQICLLFLDENWSKIEGQNYVRKLFVRNQFFVKSIPVHEDGLEQPLGVVERPAGEGDPTESQKVGAFC